MKDKKRKKIIVLLIISVFTGFFSISQAQPDIYNNPDYGVDSAARMECKQSVHHE